MASRSLRLKAALLARTTSASDGMAARPTLTGGAAAGGRLRADGALEPRDDGRPAVGVWIAVVEVRGALDDDELGVVARHPRTIDEAAGEGDGGVFGRGAPGGQPRRPPPPQPPRG